MPADAVRTRYCAARNGRSSGRSPNPSLYCAEQSNSRRRKTVASLEKVPHSMLTSSGNNVRLLLDEILEHSQANPESEPLIRRALISLRQALADSSAFVELTTRDPPTPLPNPSRISCKARAPSEDLLEFAGELQHLLNAPHALQMKDLLTLVDTIGAKIGLFPSKQALRGKKPLLAWIRANFEPIRLLLGPVEAPPPLGSAE